jgi:hypothetical protein
MPTIITDGINPEVSALNEKGFLEIAEATSWLAKMIKLLENESQENRDRIQDLLSQIREVATVGTQITLIGIIDGCIFPHNDTLQAFQIPDYVRQMEKHMRYLATIVYAIVPNSAERDVAIVRFKSFYGDKAARLVLGKTLEAETADHNGHWA